ncbi:MAG: helix-turn-helix domain-containing protein [Pseudonocardiaceae bacterium]
MSDLSDLELLAVPGMCAALASRDISTVYRLLTQAGVTQRVIAQATGQSQSEVCEILQGRQVMGYDVLVRIAAGLGVPREAMGLGYGAYAEDSADEPGEEAESDVLRRQFSHLLALAGAAAFGATVPGVGELLNDSSPPGLRMDTPSRIGTTDVGVIRSYTASLATAARTIGGQAHPAAALAEWADGYLRADASPPTRVALLSALSQLHVIVAWCCHDSYAPRAAVHHFGQAVKLATQAEDNVAASYALRHAAMMFLDRREPNDALKLVQLAQVHLNDAPGQDPRAAPLQAWLSAENALALAEMSGSDSTASRARSQLDCARDGYDPPGSHARAEMELLAAQVHLRLGSLDTAEAMAATSVRTFGVDRREGILAEIISALLHVQTGEPDGLPMADSVVSATATLRSGVARAELAPLATALEARPSSEHAQLARRARQIATTRV